MKLNCLSVNIENSSSVSNSKEWHGEMNIVIENNKSEILYAQDVAITEEDVTVVPLSYFDFMKKHHKEIFQFITKDHPDKALSDDYIKAVEFVKTLK